MQLSAAKVEMNLIRDIGLCERNALNHAHYVYKSDMGFEYPDLRDPDTQWFMSLRYLEARHRLLRFQKERQVDRTNVVQLRVKK